MYHSITIGNRNTWDDWYLIPASRPLVNPPPVKTNMVEIPGGDGILDLTESLAGRAVFGDRTGSWTFYVDNDHARWSDIYSDIMAYLHGKTFRCTLEDDPSFFYEGRFSVNQWLSEASNSKIVINYEVGPYKMYTLANGDDWLWDTFNFEEDEIRSYKNMKIAYGKPLSIRITGDTMPIIPTITVNCDADAYVVLTYKNNSYRLQRGNNILDDVIIEEGTNVLNFTLLSRLTPSEAQSRNLRGEISIKLIGGRL